MNNKDLTLTLSLVIVSSIVGILGGYFITPEYKETMFENEDMGLGEADQYVDLRYLEQMSAHHKAAILLADQVVKESHREEVRNLAVEIQKNEPVLIAELSQWKSEWYNDNSIVPEPTVPNLGSNDGKLDLRFLNALIAHHQAGVEMTQEIRTKSSRTEILNNADAVEDFLEGSLETLKSWREQWYGVK